jgi:hypothetical protein
MMNVVETSIEYVRYELNGVNDCVNVPGWIVFEKYILNFKNKDDSSLIEWK